VFQNEIDVLQARDWQDPQLSHLCQYNLHYFDDLRAQSAEQRTVWHRALIQRWVNENPPMDGPGWEPYPLSVRIVNWIQWSLAGNELTVAQRDSLAQQVRCLSQQLEFHLLANHLFANAKALLFAGVYFEGEEAKRWLTRGSRLLQQEIREQVLPDGGHFELSPMYHSLILEDLLDLLQLRRVFPDVPQLAWGSSLPDTVLRMRRWLKTMTHPDGQIALFNDAACNVAPSPWQLEQYAHQLGLGPVPDPHHGLTHLAESGYVRIQNEDLIVLLDVARIGPDYQPGHAHADTLSFECSWGDDRVIVNSGTSCYGVSAERLRQRSTSAHNTVEVDGQDSSEVWSGFRVARRAVPFDLEIDESAGGYVVGCSHSGYRRLPGRVTHRRQWSVTRARLRVQDSLTGHFQTAVSRFRLHPDWQAAGESLPDEFSFERAGRRLGVLVAGAQGRLSPSSYHPEFGLSCACHCLETHFDGHQWIEFTCLS
jgi:uncharacterized heparinase superfamily protein